MALIGKLMGCISYFRFLDLSCVLALSIWPVTNEALAVYRVMTTRLIAISIAISTGNGGRASLHSPTEH